MANLAKVHSTKDVSDRTISPEAAATAYSNIESDIEHIKQASERIYPITSPLRYANAYLSDDKTELEQMFDDEIELALFYKKNCDKANRAFSTLNKSVRTMRNYDMASFLIDIGKAGSELHSPAVVSGHVYSILNKTLTKMSMQLNDAVESINSKLQFLEKRKAVELKHSSKHQVQQDEQTDYDTRTYSRKRMLR